MKTCFKCQQAKPLTEFYRHAQMADGHLNKCKCCTKKDSHQHHQHKLATDVQWALAERGRHRDKSRRYRAAGVAPIPSNESKRQYLDRNPIKHAAHIAVHRAIGSGRLTRQPCEQCGAVKTEAHHDDYTKPLSVRWLCVRHHNEFHVKQREALLLGQLVTP